MAIQLYLSKDLNSLVKKLAEKTNRGNFNHNHIIVQTKGLRKWVNIKLAEENKISILNKFYTPNSLMEEFFDLAGLSLSDKYKVRNLVWTIFEKIEQIDEPSIKNYISESEEKRFAISFVLADLFDQYQIYRREMIQKWNSGESVYEDSTEKWQKDLWWLIKNDIGQEDRVELLDRLKQAFENNNELKNKIKDKFGELHIFGFSFFTPYHLEILLNYVAKFIDVNLYLFNPAPDIWWYDLMSERKILSAEKRERFYKKIDKSEKHFEEGNRLLTNLGTVAKETMIQIFQNSTDDIFNNLEVLPPQTTNDKKILLSEIQNAVSIAEKQNIKLQVSTISDGSVTISGSYSKLREVEALYNYILVRLEEGVKPHEILVAVTDIDEYTPYIKAVFDNYSPKTAKDEDIKVPYAIADLSYKTERNLISVFKSILDLMEENFTVEFVLNLLEYEPVRRKYGVENLQALSRIVLSSGIISGLKGDKKNDTRLISWEYGLKRLALSYAMTGDDVYIFDGDDFPVISTVEGSVAADVLRFIALSQDLINFLKGIHGKKNLEGWADFAEKSVLTIFDISDAEIRNEDQIITRLGELKNAYCGDVSFNTFRLALDKILDLDNFRGSNFINGKITFSSLVPMRSIPFKVICILGLNAEKFPRIGRKTSFDLIKKERKLGDRDEKETDRYLFLETIMSAEEKLYLSYISRDIRTNEEKPVSSVVYELIGSIEYNVDDNNLRKKVRDLLFVQHPLHLFSGKYKKDNSRVFNYVDLLKEPVFKKDELGEIELETFDSFWLGDVVNFYKDEETWFRKRILGLYEEIDGDVFNAKEKLDIDHLDNFILYKVIFESLIKETNDEKTLKLANKLQKHLPLSVAGDKVYETITEDIKKIANQINPSVKETVNKEFFVEYKEGLKFGGVLENIFGKDIILIDTSSTFYKFMFKMFIYAYLLQEKAVYDGEIERIILVYKKGKELKIMELASENFGDAIQYGKLLIDIYLEYYKNIKVPVFFDIKNKFDKCSEKKFKKEEPKILDKLNIALEKYGTDLVFNGDETMSINKLLCDKILEMNGLLKNSFD